MTDIEETGALLISIIVSARRPLTVSEFESDFESLTGRKLKTSDKWPWHQSDKFWHDYSAYIHKTPNGLIVAKSNDNNRYVYSTLTFNLHRKYRSLMGLVENTKKGDYFPMSKAVTKPQFPLFPAAEKRFESTRIENLSDTAIGDYRESSSDSSLVSEDEDYQITLPTTGGRKLMSCNFVYSFSKSLFHPK